VLDSYKKKKKHFSISEVFMGGATGGDKETMCPTPKKGVG